MAHKNGTIELSDGRCVYFAPDSRARRRNADNAVSWAEYAFHAVSSSGRLLSGNTFRERLYNENKVKGLSYIESILKAEQCFYRLIDAHPENDAILFVGYDGNCGRLEVVTRLDRYGNAEANLGEVTVIAIRKGGKRSPPPNIRPLTEVVETVAKHQAAGFSPSTTGDKIPNNFAERKGGRSVGKKEDERTGHQELPESPFAEEQGCAAGVEHRVACVGTVDAGAVFRLV